jgi:hypothetical protein
MHALRDGIRRVGKAPAVVLGVYVITLLMAAPLGIIMHEVIATDLGSSVAAEDAAVGVNWEWWEEFQSHATGVARTFNPRILGFAAVLHNQSNLVDNQLPRGEVMLAVVAYLGIWTFLVGGIIDRLARQRRVASVGFFATCGTFFFRFCRLGLLAGAAYWIVFGMVHVWLFEDLYDLATENLAVERTAFFIRIALYATFAILLLPINMVFDYAKIRAVVEDRRSMVGAVLAAIRFIRRRPHATVSLYLLNGGLFLAVLSAYAVLATSPSSGGPSMWFGFAVGQAYVVARLFTKLVFYASQTSFFQSQLAHSKYVATPTAIRLDSPAAEAVGTIS